MLYGKLGVDFFYTSELLYPNMENRLRLIRARANFYMISDNPNFSLGIVDCSLYTRRFALKDDYHKKWMDTLAYTPVELNNLETPAKTFIIPARQNQFIQESIFDNAPFRRIAIVYYLGPFHTLKHWPELYPILIHCTELCPILIHWPELYPILIYWAELYPILIHCRSIPYLNTLSQTIPDPNTLSRTIPYFNTLPSAANQIRVLRQPSRQPIRIEYYVTRELPGGFENPPRLPAPLGAL